MEKRTALNEKVYDSLSNRVYSGQYTYGEKLPSMATLTDEYDVSITTMRAALRRMQQQGLIRMAQGREAIVTFIKPVSFAHQDYARLAQRAQEGCNRRSRNAQLPHSPNYNAQRRPY